MHFCALFLQCIIFFYASVQMVELVPGSRIYAYQSQLDKVMTRTTATARARCLLMAFYSPSELIEAQNLFGTNNKKGLAKDSWLKILLMWS